MNDVCGKLCERRQNYVGKRKRILSDLSAWLLWCTIENDGKLVSRIKKVEDWIPHIQKLGANAIYFHRYSRAIHTATIREIIRRSTAVLARTRISRRLSISCMQQESRLSWMVYLTMWDAASGHFRMYLKSLGFPVQRLVPYQLRWQFQL